MDLYNYILNDYNNKKTVNYFIEHQKNNLMLLESRLISSLSEDQEQLYLKIKQINKVLNKEIKNDIITFTVNKFINK